MLFTIPLVVLFLIVLFKLATPKKPRRVKHNLTVKHHYKIDKDTRGSMYVVNEYGKLERINATSLFDKETEFEF